MTDKDIFLFNYCTVLDRLRCPPHAPYHTGSSWNPPHARPSCFASRSAEGRPPRRVECMRPTALMGREAEWSYRGEGRRLRWWISRVVCIHTVSPIKGRVDLVVFVVECVSM